MFKPSYLLPFAVIAGLTACDDPSIKVGKSSYSDLEGKIIHEGSYLDDGKITIGVVSDIEGAIDNAKQIARKLDDVGLDLLVIAGDNYENERMRRNPVFPRSTNNVQEMVEGITPFAQLNVPVFVVPGNHETQSAYEQAMTKLQEKFPNVFDINHKVADLKGVNLVGMGGYHHPRFTTPGGFLLQTDHYKAAIASLVDLQSQGEYSLLITHGPPLSKSKIDYIPRIRQNVGDQNTAVIMEGGLSGLHNVINVHGHIHEGGGEMAAYSAGPAYNVASITSYNNAKGPNAGVLTIKSDKQNLRNLR